MRGCAISDIKDKYADWLKHQMDYYGRYHNHKETMAWVATAFYLAGIMYLAFRVHSIVHLTCPGKTLYSLLFFVSGYLVFCFVNWQFKMRWNAYERVGSLTRDLAQAVFCSKQPSLPEYEAIPRRCGEFRKVLKYLLPWRLCERHNPPRGELEPPDDEAKLEPLRSEALTYVAIAFVTVVAIVLVCVH